jgi:hypothetical protein
LIEGKEILGCAIPVLLAVSFSMKLFSICLAPLVTSTDPLALQHAEIMQSFYGGAIEYKTPTHMCVPKYLDGLMYTIAATLPDRCSTDTKGGIISGLERFGKDILQRTDSELEVEKMCFEIESMNERINDFSEFRNRPIGRSIYMEFGKSGYKLLSVANVNIMPFVFPGNVGMYLGNILEIAAILRNDRLAENLLRNHYAEEILKGISELMTDMMRKWEEYQQTFPDFLVHYPPLDFFIRRLTEPRFPPMTMDEIARHRDHLDLLPIEIDLQRVFYRHELLNGLDILERFHEVIAVHRLEMGQEIVDMSIRAVDLLISSRKRFLNILYLGHVAHSWAFCLEDLNYRERVTKELGNFISEIQAGKNLVEFADEEPSPLAEQASAAFSDDQTFHGIRLRNVLRISAPRFSDNDAVRLQVLTAYQHVFKRERYSVKTSALIKFAVGDASLRYGYDMANFFGFCKAFGYNILDHVSPKDVNLWEVGKLATIQRLIPLLSRIDDQFGFSMPSIIIKSNTGFRLYELANSIETYLAEKRRWLSRGSLIGRFPIDAIMETYERPNIEIGLFMRFVSQYSKEFAQKISGSVLPDPVVLTKSVEFEVLRRSQLFPALEKYSRNGVSFTNEYYFPLVTMVYRSLNTWMYLNKGKKESVRNLHIFESELRRIISGPSLSNHADQLKNLFGEAFHALTISLYRDRDINMPSFLRIIETLKQL